MLPVRRQISPHAANLRREMTEVERVMWNALRNRQIDGFKFRRQATMGPYIVDFLCIEPRLVVELDGGQHDEQRDAGRTAFIEAQGYMVQRFWNSEIVENRAGVLEMVRALLLERADREED
jgi:very-short-patch-repair endonuclease